MNKGDNQAHANAIRYKDKRVKALYSDADTSENSKDGELLPGIVVGGWENSEQNGLKIKFDFNSKIQDVPFWAIELDA